jgi:hypothetical protein
MAPPDSIFSARERGRIWRGGDRDHSLSCSGYVCALGALSEVNHCSATKAIANAGKKSAKSFALMSRLAGFPSKTDTLRQNLDGQRQLARKT